MADSIEVAFNFNGKIVFSIVTFNMLNLVCCPVLQDTRLGQFHVLRYLYRQSVVLSENQPIQDHIRRQVDESGRKYPNPLNTA